VVGTSADHTDIDAVALVPAGVAIDNVNAVAGVQVVDGTFTVDTPDLSKELSLAIGIVYYSLACESEVVGVKPIKPDIVGRLAGKVLWGFRDRVRLSDRGV
jgi:hypothetical protein